jgi:prepilin-type N-terminal cleavage/methylation domain-containing protein
MKLFSKRRGFTLIELLVVIAIIGLLASIISVSLQSARAKGRDGKRVSDIRTLQLSLEEYYNDNGQYPNTLASLAPTYLPNIPCDPNSNASCSIPYKYTAYDLTATSGGSTNCGIYARVKYHAGAALEDSTNSALSQDTDFVAGATYTVCSSSGADFNGTAPACTGTTGALTDTCYDVTN